MARGRGTRGESTESGGMWTSQGGRVTGRASSSGWRCVRALAALGRRPNSCLVEANVVQCYGAERHLLATTQSVPPQHSEGEQHGSDDSDSAESIWRTRSVAVARDTRHIDGDSEGERLH